MTMNEILIVSRHAGAIEFVESAGFSGDVVEHFSPDMASPGMIIVGILPIPLIQEVLDSGARFILIIMPSIPQEMRGVELNPWQMRQYGARLVEIQNIDTREVNINV